MNQPQPQTNQSAGSLVLSNPLNIVEFLVFYAPVVLATIVFIIPTAVMDPKGAVYLALLLGVCCLRIFLFGLFKLDPYTNDNTVCTMVKYSDYGNSYVSIFVISYTLAYLCSPMIYHNSINYMVLSLLILYLVVSGGIFFYRNCIKSTSEVFINILIGVFLGTMIPVFFYMGGSSKYLFFNEMSSDKDICTMPSTQTFKCNVYKNGQIIG